MVAIGQSPIKRKVSVKKMFTLSNIKETLVGFALTTTIHGFRYLYEGRNLFEKLSWFITISLCFFFAGMMITQSILDSAREPILTTMDTAKIQQVPFPAITIGFVIMLQ